MPRLLLGATGAAYLALVAVNLAYLLPILTGQPVPEAGWQARLWLPGWT
ncbi:hypothetical protein ACFQY7_43180 [Actinomadura luteofluorescens]